jgi:hypothetical protein
MSILDVERLQASSQLIKEPQSWSWEGDNVNFRFDLAPHSLAAITLEFETDAFEKTTERR